MPAKRKRDEGKTAFVRQALQTDPNANSTTVNKA
jgi:hypothetical protein